MSECDPRAFEATERKLRECDHFPLSLSQEALWFLQCSQPESPVYNAFCHFRLLGPLDISALERSLNEIVRRHEALRTTFLTTGEGEPRQVVAAALNLSLHCVDLRSVPPSERESEMLRCAREASRHPFDLKVGPLFRSSLLVLDRQVHVLLLSLHHLVSDAWSMEILGRELSLLYRAFAAGAGSTLPDLPIAYADFAVWQRQLLRGSQLEQQLTYWRQRLAGASYLLNLPVDRRRPTAPRDEGAALSFRLLPSLSADIRALSRRKDATLFMTLLAAFAVFLSRHTGQSDIIIGSAVANRTRADVESVIGLFANTLVLRIDLSGDPTFLELLSRVRETSLDAHAHRILPFDILIRELRPPRASNHAPLIQAAFGFQNAPPEPLKLPGISVTPLEVHNGTAKFDLGLSITDTSQGMACSLEYRTDLFDADTIVRMHGHFETLLAGAVSDPSQRLSNLPILSASERAECLTGEASGGSAPAGLPLAQLFEIQVDRTPDAIAINYCDEQLTYRDLNARANRLAHRLRDLRVGPEVRVGVCVDRSTDILVAILAVLKAGGAYVPIDPTYPEERLAFILRDAGARTVVISERLTGLLPNNVVKAYIETSSVNERDQSLANPASTATEDNLAYVIYTSGSTGNPKGVCVTHRNVTNLFSAAAAWAGFVSSDVWTLFHSYAFDFSVWEMWGALLYGGRLVVVPKPMTELPEQFLDLLRTERVTVLNQTPSAFRRLFKDEGVWTGTSLRMIVFGGEALPSAEFAEWQRSLSGIRLINMYGITETTVHVTRYEVPLGKPERSDGSDIGRPLADMRLYVLDSAMNLTPRGVSGELYVGGRGVARGYLDRPALTASRFLPDPYGSPGERLYRTGDMARHLDDGTYVYVGRLDRQVKLRGYRIELGEVESALRRHPNVREAVVEVHTRSTGESSLLAYLSGAEMPVEALRVFLGERLPEYMAPSTYVWLDRLPLTPNGKVDRSALPEPSSKRPSLSARYEAPRTPEEHTIANVWRSVLGIDTIGVHDNFFDLGGASLTIVKVKDQLERLFHLCVPTVLLFQQPTVARLAATIGSLGRNSGPMSEPERGTAEVAARRRNGRVDSSDIAVIGVAGRFPGARDARTLWSNLCDARESISVFSDDDLRSASVPPDIIRDVRYVRSRGILRDVEYFDYEFFGLNARDARSTDPQHRVFLEICWQALADAGYSPDQIDFPVGVFAGAGPNHYRNLFAKASHDDTGVCSAAESELRNEKDYLTTTVSYHLRLTGPSVDVQSACSTSLVAVHLACRSLVDADCDMALAGGVSIVLPEISGYLHTDGGIGSPDGHCRAFDKGAAGCVPGNGCGVVVLKRLADALRDEDYIYAVIRGSAANNDGGRKVGFTAPSVEGQADVINRALRRANTSPGEVAYIETHGTATALGDPIEIEALRQVFEGHPALSCSLGSIKSNIGHLDVAAGIAGLIKTVFAIKHRQLPASLHFREANPRIDFAATPFFVVQQLSDWPARDGPRVAGVSSFGIGGTNCHVVVAGAPEETRDVRPARTRDVVVLSARTPDALEQMRAELAEFLIYRPETAFEDVCCTLQTARPTMRCRFAVHCSSRSEAIDRLRRNWTPDARSLFGETGDRKVALLFSEAGSIKAGLVKDLYGSQTVFRAEVNALIDMLPADMNSAMRLAFESASPLQNESGCAVPNTGVFRAFHVVSQLALANTWRRWGVEPAAVLGCGLGELSSAVFVEACTFTDALRFASLDRPLEANESPLLESSFAVELGRPRIPLISAANGSWISSQQTLQLDVDNSVASEGFSRAIRTLSDSRCFLLLEINAGTPLVASAQQRVATESGIRWIRSLGEAGSQPNSSLEAALAELWQAGVHVDWIRYRAGTRGRRTPLPGYPFERRRCWINLSNGPPQTAEDGDRLHTPTWKRVPVAPAGREYANVKGRVLVLASTAGAADAVRSRWRGPQSKLITAIGGDEFEQRSTTEFVLRYGMRDDYERLVSRLLNDGSVPTAVAHIIGAAEAEPGKNCRESPVSVSSCAHSSLLLLARAMEKAAIHGMRWYVIGKRLFNITGDEPKEPYCALIAGVAEWLSTRPLSVHTELCEIDSDIGDVQIAESLLERLAATPERGASVRYAKRGRHRWSQSLDDASGFFDAGVPFGEPDAVYLLTGYPSPLWLGLCEHLSARRARALLLLSDESAPTACAWPQFVETRGTDVEIKAIRPAPLDIIPSHTRLYSWRCNLVNHRSVRASIAAIERQVGPIRGAIYSPLLTRPPTQAQTRFDPIPTVLERSMEAVIALHAALSDRALDFTVCLDDLYVGPGSDVDAYLAGTFAETLVENRNNRGEGAQALFARVRGGRTGEVTSSGQCPVMHLPGGWDTLGAALRSGVCSLTFLSTTGPEPVASKEQRAASLSCDTLPTVPSLQEQIASIWYDVLGAPVGRADGDFFELGGNSLLALELATRFSTSFRVNVALQHILDHPTLDGLVEFIASLQLAASPGALLEQDFGDAEQAARRSPDPPVTPRREISATAAASGSTIAPEPA